jgi:hypothetical protein
MPNTVQNPVVGLGLQEAVDEKTSDGQWEAGQVVKEQCATIRMQFSIRYTNFDLLFREKTRVDQINCEIGKEESNWYPSKNSDTERDGQEDDESHIAESIVQIDAQTSQQADEEREHFPLSSERRHGQDGNDERRIRAYEVGQLQSVVVEYAKRVELLVTRVVKLKYEEKESILNCS